MRSGRRRFLSAALAGLTAKGGTTIQGGLVNESAGPGHRLRDRMPHSTPVETRRAPLVIVGAGVAGLSAAWQLARRGFHDFAVLEMEREAGGNARWGRNEVSAYPWAAHYLPVPGPHSTLVRELAAELGLLQNGHWDERHLCHAPQERLFLHGRWQEDLEPHIGLTRADAAEFRRLEDLLAEARATRRFTIPMEEGLARCGPAERELDRLTFAAWLRHHGMRSHYVHWYADYATRDDYGTSAEHASAWAGIHYFAAREPEDKGPLTWPQGNGWIVERMLRRLARYVEPRSLVWRIEPAGVRYRVLTERTTWLADAVIFAAPTFLASYLIDPAPPAWPLTYAPWLTANLTLEGWPANKGAEYAWDNVIYDSPGLGYVIATHQNLGVYTPRTVWTYYTALNQGEPADMRRVLLGGDWAYWRERVLTDLERAHPDIRRWVSRIDIMRLGHAMPRPTPGAIFNDERRRRARPHGRLIYANSDLSALSLFEEAQYRGVTAADAALRALR
jgi:glycine/D-amino acid oxidase-like deaminating enzyme